MDWDLEVALATRIFDVLRAIEADATTVRDGYPTGLRWLHAHLGRTGKDTTEDAISEALAERLPGGGDIVSAQTQVPYPNRLRELDDGVTRGTCDLALELAGRGRMWVEVKCAWPYLREGTELRRNAAYVKHVVSPTEGAARDFAKLAPVAAEEAHAVAVLLIGFDIDDPDSPFAIADAQLNELEANGRVHEDGWHRIETEWRDPHPARVYDHVLGQRCRTRCLLWVRELEFSPLEYLAELLHRRNSLSDQIARLIGRPPERGHVGEFIAANVFDIDLHDSASHPGSDGVFRSGPLAGRSVNIKFYGAHDGLLDVATGTPPDVYLVLTGPREPSGTSRGRTRPVVVAHVFLFEHEALVEAGVRPGAAASVRRSIWKAAQVHPTPSEDALLTLTREQRDTLSLFRTPGT